MFFVTIEDVHCKLHKAIVALHVCACYFNDAKENSVVKTYFMALKC